MMENLFIYGTLQIPEIQMAVFGRTITPTADTLHGFQKTQVKLGTGFYPMLVRHDGAEVAGGVISVTPQELGLIDRYETAAYQRIKVQLASDTVAWVYVATSDA